MTALAGTASDASTVVVALGGNALQPPGERGDIHQQFAHARESLGAIVALAGAGWNIAIVHGNGPQIGDELLRNEVAREHRPPLPLGVLVAGTAGWIGYMIQQSLQNALARAHVQRSVVTLITQVVVDRDAVTTRVPTKPIGRVMDEETARSLAAGHRWAIQATDDGWRRVVPSPVPLEIVERSEIRRLVSTGAIVVAAGGGGTPVYVDEHLGLEGVDAVIDKDRAAAVLARDLDAAVLLILTNVEGVYQDWGKPERRLVRSLCVQDAQRMIERREVAAGSMLPKVEAAAAFVRANGGRAVIARLDQGLEAVHGETGTEIVP
jgi:carbamate kinase